MKQTKIESALSDFRIYLENEGLTPNVINSYTCWTRKALNNADYETLAGNVTMEDIYKANPRPEKDPSASRIYANTQSALKHFEKFMCSQNSNMHIAAQGPILVKLSRQAFKIYLASVYRKEDGNPLTQNTINAFASTLTRISKINIYNIWHEVEPLNQALDRIQDDDQFNTLDHGGCKAALPIFIQAVEDIAAGRYKAAEVHVSTLTGKEI